ncbi:MAG: ribulose-phosphate 3-epimerase [Candidatus Eisenbacteria bacterium]|nr:ribulose-phosphate 3-epimerase [Candidatus Eisenbacteria bacterium]
MSEQRILISPSILAADFARLGEEIETVVEAGADMIHIDVMDGHFVPNITLGPVIVRAVRSVTDVPIDAHLMITDPAEYAPAFIDAGADYIMFHSEVCKDAHEVIELIRARGAKPGLAVNPPNPAAHIEPYLEAIDLALVMTVNPGFAGQSFIPDVMPKLRQIADWKRERGLSFLIEVDGGVGPDTAPEVARNGGEVLVAASAIFGHDDRAAALRDIRTAATAALER